MTSSQRIIVNTTAQYTRTIINVCLSLYSTRLVLAALGQTDYGIYSVVAGVVSMISFITTALASSNQRFLSFYYGKEDYQMIRKTFGNSLIIHIAISLLILFVLLSLKDFLTGTYLNIDDNRRSAANVVYLGAMTMLCLSFITAPFKSLYIARENIVYTSIVDVCNGILKLLIAIWLTHMVSYEKLEVYALLLVGISIYDFFAYAIYASIKFDECKFPHLNDIDIHYIKQIFMFAGWNIYGTGCIIARTQGIAIIINKFWGVIANAAYGIALQINGGTNFISSSILSAMSPQIIKAKGSSNENRMDLLSLLACKYATLMLCLIAIPLIVEMPTILQIWLNEYPADAVLLCRGMLIASIIDQWTIGLTTANQAVGKIAKFTFTVNSVKLFSLPLAYICAKCGLPLIYIVYCFTIGEFACSILRIPFITNVTNITFLSFNKTVTLPLIIPVISICAACVGITYITNVPFRLIYTLAIGLLTGTFTTYLFSLTKEEKNIIFSIINRKR